MSNYWQERAEQRLLSAEEKALRLEKKLKQRFQQVYKNLEAEFAKIYFQFADESGLDYGNVKKKLTAKEKEQFRRDLEYYIQNAKNEENKKRLTELYKGVTTRLEAKKASIQAEVQSLYLQYLDTELQLTLGDVLDEGYYRTIFDLQQHMGFGMSFTTLSPHVLTSLLDYPWSGKNYSEKIWGHVRGFSSKIEDVLTVGIIQGKSNQKMARELTKACEVEYKRAIALIRTETNFIANEATSRAYEELKVLRYRYLATLDLKTSQLCRELDRKVFEMAKKQVGVNYPPMHTHCRSTTVPELDEEIQGTRIARKSDGSTYKVERNMSYNKWYAEHVATDKKELLAEKKIKNRSRDKEQYIRYKEAFVDEPKSFEAFLDIKYSEDRQKEYKELKRNYRAYSYIGKKK